MPDNKPPAGPDPKRPGGEGPPPPTKLNRNLMGWVIFIGLALLLMSVVYKNMSENRRDISADEFWTHVRNGHVKALVIKDQEIEGELREDIPGQEEGQTLRFLLAYDHTPNDEFEKRLAASPRKIHYTYKIGEGWWAFLPQLLIWVVIFLLIWFFFFRQLRGSGGGAGFLGSFGRSRHRLTSKEHTDVTFEDVAGIEEAKEEVGEIIEFLKNPRRFQRLGARIPRGVLLLGLPGCGKTLLAKAIAGEADVPFFSISGSDFVEMFVGVGASRVRDLFKQAKENSPCIIFLDEIDAVGRRRGAGFNGGGHDEREQTLNAILVEMDGFDSNDQVIVIAATNRMDVLDPALTRPGRFDRQIDVPLPDIKGRVDILKIYVAKVNSSPDVDLQRVARGTPMFSGADLAALVNEAAITATLSGKESVEQADMEEARDKVRWGRARKSRVIDEQEKTITAYHEAGHALVQVLTPDADPLHKVSIIPRGPAGGATLSLPEKDRHIYTRKYCRAMLQVCLGGRLAEEQFCDDVSSGAESDIQQATTIARKMVLDWGMSDKLGFIRYAKDEQNAGLLALTGKEYSDATAEVIDAEVRGIIDGASAAAVGLIESHRDKIEALAQALLKYETLSDEEVRQILAGTPLQRPNVTDLLDAEQAKRRAEEAPVGESTEEEGPAPGALPQPG